MDRRTVRVHSTWDQCEQFFWLKSVKNSELRRKKKHFISKEIQSLKRKFDQKNCYNACKLGPDRVSNHLRDVLRSLYSKKEQITNNLKGLSLEIFDTFLNQKTPPGPNISRQNRFREMFRLSKDIRENLWKKIVCIGVDYADPVTHHSVRVVVDYADTI